MTARLVVSLLVVLAACEPAPSTCTLEATTGLPDPLVQNDGGCITTKAAWPARREELLELFRKNVYGRAPGAPESLEFTVLEEDPNAMSGAATLRRVAITNRQAGRTHTFELLRFAPNSGARSGVLLLISHRPRSHTDPTRVLKSEFWPAEEVIARGYAIAAIQGDELAPDDRDTYTNGVIHLFEGDIAQRRGDAWKMVGAWAWGASRAMDALEVDPMIDASRVAVIGHSRAGKAALWAGAQDERFSLTISNNSGCAGAALSRRPVGETVALINGVFPHFFADTFRRYDNNEAALPIDQHELLALLAPRAVAVGSASNDEWSDPEGEYLGLAYASQVYGLYGLAPVEPAAWPKAGEALYVAPRGYHVRIGDHALVGSDWQRYLDVADKAWSR